MPLYEYSCESCGERFEVMQKFSDEPLQIHEKCGGPVHRLISAPALQFKGSGWYITDYAKGGSSSEKSGDNGTPAKADAKDKTTSSAKQDAPAPASASSSSSDSKSTSSDSK